MGRIILAARCWPVLTSPALAVTVRCTTYEERTLNRRHTLGSDGTRGTSIDHRMLQRWESTLIRPTGRGGPGRLFLYFQPGHRRGR